MCIGFTDHSENVCDHNPQFLSPQGGHSPIKSLRQLDYFMNPNKNGEQTLLLFKFLKKHLFGYSEIRALSF